MRNNQAVKLFIVLFVCTAFVFSFSHFGAIAFHSLSSEDEGFRDGTVIGSVDVSGKSKSEALSLLTERLTKWGSETTINLRYKEKTVSVDVSKFKFDLAKSVSSAQEGNNNAVIVSIKSGDLYQMVKDASDELSTSTIEMDAVQTELLAYAGKLSTGNFQLQLDRFLVDASNKVVVISSSSITPKFVPLDLGLMVEELSPIKVEANTAVSMLKLLEENNLASLPSEGLSMIATTVYQTLLSSNFKIVEKHTGQVLPDYASLGMEAKVDFANHLDFAFMNPNDTEYEIELKLENGKLISSLKGNSFLYSYKVAVSDKKEYEPKTVVQYSPLLSPSAKRLKQSGTRGQRIKVFREIFDEKNVLLGKEFVAEDFYPPIPKIEVHGLVAPASDGNTDGQTGTPAPGDENPGNTPGGTPGGAPAQPQTPQDPNVDPGDDDGFYGKPNEQLK